MKKLNTLSLILIIGYSILEIFKYFRPTFYGEQFNDIRIELNLKPITSEMSNLNGNSSIHQKWGNNNFESIGFYQKYLLFGDWDNKILNEEDIYVILIDSQKKILALSYDFKNEKMTYSIEEFQITNSRISMSNEQENIEAIEAKQILKLNGIKY